ncbi:MAG: M20/M25/M40 family metallo-hydrolase [Synergistaceae bacterium]|jgi:LysW-gamma-L-lysine carboxypeptidase|nr:M20/M25/M40 family metallo-hydrolase [Synergistaceae bacterium]
MALALALNSCQFPTEAQARELLIRLVEIPGVTGSEERACEYLAQALSAYGWEDARLDEVGSVVARRGCGEREIVLLGHIDTVPGGPVFCVEGDVLWGRGSVDARGPLCAFVVAGGAVEVPDGWRLTLIAAVGEEGDSRGAKHVIPLHSPAACVVGEPSGTSGVTVGYRGYLRLQVSAQDAGVHRSGDAGPVTTSLMAASDILRNVDGRDNPEKPVIERPFGAVISMCGREAGTRSGFVDLDVRLPLGASPDAWAEEFIEIGERRGVDVKLISSMPAHLVDKNDPLARVLRVAVRDAGLTPRLLAKGGTADFNLAAAWNCPMAAYGPGDSKLDHTAEEHIDLNEYLASISILKNALERFMRERP